MKNVFTTCTNQDLQDKSEDIFQEWTQDALQHSPPRLTPSEQNTRDIDSAILRSIDVMFSQGSQHALTPRELRARKRTNLTENVNSRQDNTDGQNSTATVLIDEISDVRQDNTKRQNQCRRTVTHPLHVISTARPPDPIDTWPDKQLEEDIPKGTTRVPKENLKERLPANLIVVKDEKGRERILVPRCQRGRLVVTEHQTMLHVEGARVHYELARKYIWPNMARDIKIICKACETCEKSKVRRQNLSAEFEQADKDDIPLPRQAYGVDFYGHAKGEILVAIDLCTRGVNLWFLTDRKTEGSALLEPCYPD